MLAPLQRTTSLALSVVVACFAPRAAAQSSEPPAAEAEVISEETIYEPELDILVEPVEWEGPLYDNLVVSDPLAFGGRGILDTKDPMIAPFVGVLNASTKFVEENLKGFDSSGSKRDAAFHAVNLIMVTGVVWVPTMTAAGAVIGAAGSGSASFGSATVAGGLAGGVVGGVGGVGVMCSQMMLAVGLGLAVNELYPAPDVDGRSLAAADGSRLPLFEEPEQWIVERLREELAARAAAEQTDGGDGAGGSSGDADGGEISGRGAGGRTAPRSTIARRSPVVRL